MMRFFKKFVPILLSFFIVCGVIFSSYDTAKATGMEEYLYVTYWDLMNTLYSMCGYDMKVSDDQVKNHGVTGKQAWNNFTSFVDNAAKVHWKLYSDAGKAAVKELKDLANTAMEKGISISQDLYDMLKDVFGYQAKYANIQNQFDCSSVKAVNDYIESLTGGGYLDSGRAQQLVDGKALLNIIYDPYYPRYTVFALNKSVGIVDDFRVDRVGEDFYSCIVKYPNGEKKFYSVYGSIVMNGKTMLDVACYTCQPGFSWVIKNGAFILIFCILAVSIHLVVTLLVGKMFKFKLDELLLASNACIGGPTTAVAMAIAKGWNSLIVPTMIAGVWGYVLGNYAGIIVGHILQIIL